MEIYKSGGDNLSGGGDDSDIKIIRESDLLGDSGDGSSDHQDVFDSHLLRSVQISVFD
jgi:hypothetical protein